MNRLHAVLRAALLAPVVLAARLAPVVLATASCGVGGTLAIFSGGGGGGGGSSAPPPRPQSAVIAPLSSATNLVSFAYVLRDERVKKESPDGRPGGADDPRILVRPQWQLIPEQGDDPVDPSVWNDMSPADVPQSEPTRAVPLGQHTFVWNLLPDYAAGRIPLLDSRSRPRPRVRVRVRVLAEYEETAGFDRRFRIGTSVFRLDNRLAATVAGGEVVAPTDVDTFPVDLRPDGTGFLVADFGANIVERIDEAGLVRRVLGFGVPGDTVGTGKSPGVARLTTLIGVEADAAGNLYTNHADSLLVTNRTAAPLAFGATSVPPFTVMRGATGLSQSRDVRLHPTGALLFLDQGATLFAFNRQPPGGPGSVPIVLAGVTIDPGTAQVIAGGGSSTAEDVPALDAQISTAVGIAVGPDGEIYVVESESGRVRVVNTGTTDLVVGTATVAPGTIRTVAGGAADVVPRLDAGPAASSALVVPAAIDVSSARGLFIADTGHLRVVLVNLGAATATFAETVVPPGDFGTVVGVRGATGGVGSKSRDLRLANPNALTLDQNENLLIADERSVILANGLTTTVTSYGKTAIAARTARVHDAARRGGVPLTEPRAVHASSPDEVFFTDRATVRVMNLAQEDRIFGGESAAPGAFVVIGGGAVPGFGGDGGSARGAAFSSPSGLATQGSRRLFVADTGNHRIRLVNLGDPRLVGTEVYLGKSIVPGAVDTIVGGAAGAPPADGDGGLAGASSLSGPESVAVGPDGLLWICDTGHHKVRVVNPGDDPVTVVGVTVLPGTIATIVGDGTPGFSGDGAGPWTTNLPSAVALDNEGVLYFAERGNSRIRCLNTTGDAIERSGISIPAGETRTLVGTGVAGNAGDGGDGPSAKIAAPRSLLVQSRDGVPLALFFADEVSHVVRMLNLSETDDLALAVDADGRVLTTIPASGIFSVAGGPNTLGVDNAPGFSGDGEVAERVRFDSPFGIAVTTGDGLPIHFFVADRRNDRLRRFGAPPLTKTN